MPAGREDSSLSMWSEVLV